IGFHEADAVTCGNNLDLLLGQARLDSSHPVRRHAAVIDQPLPDEGRHAVWHSVDGCAGTKPSDHAQPCLEVMEEGVCSREGGLLIKRNPEIRRVAAQGLPEEAGRRDADDREGMSTEDEARADDFRIRAVFLLPGAIANHCNRRRRCLVVRGLEGASGEGAKAKGVEVVAADEFAPQRLGDAIALAAASADWSASSLKRGELFELRRVLLHELIEGIREHAPVILWAALDAAVLPVADAVETGRIHHGQRLEHYGVDKRKDGGRGSDAERQREHGGHGKDWGLTHLSECVRDVLAQSLHVGLWQRNTHGRQSMFRRISTSTLASWCNL